MAWFGQIVDFDRQDNGWLAKVEFYDDANASLRIPVSFNWPFSDTRAQALNDIKTKGAEVRSYATINTAQIIGTVVSIP